MEKPASPDNIARRTRLASRKESVAEPEPEPAPHSRPHKISDYILPPLRRLGPYQGLSHTVASADVTGPVEFGLQKAVGLVLRAAHPDSGFSAEFLHQLTNLATQYMGQLFRLLHECTEVQRHQRPGIADLEMCLSHNHVDTRLLSREYSRSAKLPADIQRLARALRNLVDATLREYYAENYHLDKDDPSLVFHANEQYEVAALVPRQVKERSYIPSYLPDLPPDFTYQYTGNYMKTLTDLKEIKLKLVDESRLNEALLYRLIDNDDGPASDIDSACDDIMSDVGSVSDVETPEDSREAGASLKTHESAQSPKESAQSPKESAKTLKESTKTPTESAQTPTESGAPLEEPAAPQTDKRFDFVAYARSRRLSKQRQERAVATRRRQRRHNVFMRAETMFSSYADSLPDHDFVTATLRRGFKRVINATRRAEQAKKQRITELLALKAKAEQEHEQNNAIEFGFSFNHASSLSDSDDDDEPEEFDFGDSEPAFGGDLNAGAVPHVGADESMGRDLDLAGGADRDFSHGPALEVNGALEAIGTKLDDHAMATMDHELDSALSAVDIPDSTWPHDWHHAQPAQDDSDEGEFEDL